MIETASFLFRIPAAVEFTAGILEGWSPTFLRLFTVTEARGIRRPASIHPLASSLLR